jgi:signal peptidase I
MKITKSKIILITLYFLIIILLSITIISNIYNSNNIIKNSQCITVEKLVEVRGSSLSGIIEPSENIKILINYYECNQVERNDIVAYNFTGNEVPIIKIVKGIEGDKFQLKKIDNCYNILINNKIVKNSKNIPYCINEQGYRMLSLYEKDYNNIIPKNTYLLLGNLATGSTDSTRFGLVDKSDFIGKVIKVK